MAAAPTGRLRLARSVAREGDRPSEGDAAALHVRALGQLGRAVGRLAGGRSLEQLDRLAGGGRLGGQVEGDRERSGGRRQHVVGHGAEQREGARPGAAVAAGVGAAKAMRASWGSRSAAAIRRSFAGSAALPFSMSSISPTASPQVRESSSKLYPRVSRIALRLLESGPISLTNGSERALIFAFWGIGNSGG